MLLLCQWLIKNHPYPNRSLKSGKMCNLWTFFLLFPPSKWFEWSREFPISQQEREEKLQKGLTFSTIFPFLDLPVCEILISVHQELKFFYHLWFRFGKNVHKYIVLHTIIFKIVSETMGLAFFHSSDILFLQRW